MFWTVILFVISLSTGSLHNLNLEPSVKDDMLIKVNEIRKKGCHCGRRYMAPAPPVKWNETLYSSALNHAMDMYKNNFFAHFSSEGLNIGDRLEKHGYDWQVVGENLGVGQTSFDEVLTDWMKSYSHCVMVMNPKVDEMAVAKYSKYWVQHFGKKMKR
jgi:uncharacterized protein YkwD